MVTRDEAEAEGATFLAREEIMVVVTMVQVKSANNMLYSRPYKQLHFFFFSLFENRKYVEY